MRVAVTGAGGFIGSHLVKELKRCGHWVRGIDIKRPVYDRSPADEWYPTDLRSREDAYNACRGVERIYHLAADMGGIGYISKFQATIMFNNMLTDLHVFDAARRLRHEGKELDRVFYMSSACVYPIHIQADPSVTKLAESMAWPCNPEPGYGFEKLAAEHAAMAYGLEHGVPVRIGRAHNAYGPLGAYVGGREKAPAAACRKVALSQPGEEIEIWGDGLQTRSFMYIDDCVEGILRLTDSDYSEPVNIGSEELVTVTQLFQLVGEVAGKELQFKYNLDAPQGVRGRNSDNTKIRELLGWEPSIKLKDGLSRTYPWIAKQLGVTP